MFARSTFEEFSPTHDYFDYRLSVPDVRAETRWANRKWQQFRTWPFSVFDCYLQFTPVSKNSDRRYATRVLTVSSWKS
jgi:hypothetical protein